MYEVAMPGKPVIQLMYPMLLIEELKWKNITESVNFIKEKRYGHMKERTCTNGSRQCRYLNNGDTVASPTVSLEILFVTLVVKSHEWKYVVTFDVTGSFIHAQLLKGGNIS